MSFQDDSEFLCVAALKERGWTAASIAKFLGTPDKCAKNPHYKNGPVMKLYSRTRVVSIEESSKFIEAKAKSQKRSETGLACAAKRRDALCDSARQMTITVSREEPLHVLMQAIANYNHRGGRRIRRDWEPASEHSEPEFLRRIQVNYIRHQLTQYDEALELVAARVGVHEAVFILRQRVYDKIAEVYPEFKEECQRQWEKRKREYEEMLRPPR